MGVPQNYDEWRDVGAGGWRWNEVLPYFRRLERNLDFCGIAARGGGVHPV